MTNGDGTNGPLALNTVSIVSDLETVWDPAITVAVNTESLIPLTKEVEVYIDDDVTLTVTTTEVPAAGQAEVIVKDVTDGADTLIQGGVATHTVTVDTSQPGIHIYTAQAKLCEKTTDVYTVTVTVTGRGT